MTIKKSVALSAAVAALVSTGLFAAATANPGTGVLQIGNGSPSTVASEIFNLNGTVSIPVGQVRYQPNGIPSGSLTNPVFKFISSHKFVIASGNTLGVYELNTTQPGCNDANITAGNLSACTSNILVANNPTSSANGTVVGFTDATSSAVYINNAKWYIIDSDANAATTTNELNVTMTSATDVTLETELYSGDSNDLVDSTPKTTIATATPEFSAVINPLFDARINTAQLSKKFYDGYDTGADQNDTVTIAVTDKNLTYNVLDIFADATINTVVYSDVNITNYVPISAVNRLFNANMTYDVASGDFNTTGSNIVYNADATTNITLTYATNGNAIDKTKFGADLFLSNAAGTLKKDILTSSFTKGDTGYAGIWDLYGYQAQIPNVAQKPGSYDTSIKFTNRGTVGTSDIFFTLIDMDGTIVKLDSVNDGLSQIAQDATSKYKASDLAALAVAKDQNFDDANTFSVEVSIPVTPDSVYGMASFVNTSVNGQAKDLPVYNTSTMTY